MTTYRPRRKGERKRKSVRGCITGPDLSVIQLSILKKGTTDQPGLTDDEKPVRLGPKRATNIRKAFVLKKGDDVKRYVVRREIKKGDRTWYKSPKVQRLVTDVRIRRKTIMKKIKQERFKLSKDNKAKYEKLLSTYLKEQKVKKEQHKKEKEETHKTK